MSPVHSLSSATCNYCNYHQLDCAHQQKSWVAGGHTRAHDSESETNKPNTDICTAAYKRAMGMLAFTDSNLNFKRTSKHQSQVPFGCMLFDPHPPCTRTPAYVRVHVNVKTLETETHRLEKGKSSKCVSVPLCIIKLQRCVIVPGTVDWRE